MNALLLTLLSTAGAAENTLSLSPLGALGFTLHNVADYALTFEHRREHHGLVAEFNGVHIHGDPTHTTTLGGNLGYRLHSEGGTFVGVMAGYKQGFSKYYTDETHENFWRYDVTHVSLIPHIGHRFSLGERWRITARLGAGYGRYSLTTDVTEEGIDEATALLSERLQFTPIKLDSALSLGVAF